MLSYATVGRELFEHVARTKGLDGVVINPSGPGRPLAFARGVADLVMSSE